ncbi:hypothetical protein SASPL_131388 [Salvia splendens]|uniref:CRIB domain-containing protein n=1 Tax=Salvia splendens TaxID=180675 RepID=A0A8X8XA13_SALSN|nr:hypothetical protein SASPL_131388 [Salvia splendens]
MRGGRLERFVLIPFSIRCDSESSVALAVATTASPKQPKTRGVKTVYKEEMEQMEMEIGFPTDVKHVAHIGLDGSTSSLNNWENLKASEILSFPSISLQQFELAMASQSR